jgi:hypothetical protein
MAKSKTTVVLVDEEGSRTLGLEIRTAVSQYECCIIMLDRGTSSMSLTFSLIYFMTGCYHRFYGDYPIINDPDYGCQ